MKRAAIAFAALVALAILVASGSSFAQIGGIVPPPPTPNFSVVPFEHGNNLVAAFWRHGLGCISNGASNPSSPIPYDTYVCPVPFDTADSQNEALELAKSAPTLDTTVFAGAHLVGVEGSAGFFEIGWDIRKDPIAQLALAPIGSHCGESPRFVVTTLDGVVHNFFCKDGILVGESSGWTKLIWLFIQGFPTPVLPTDTIQRIDIIFDAGPDPFDAVVDPATGLLGADSFGLVVLDNILLITDPNAPPVIVGSGQSAHQSNEDSDEDRGGGEDQDHDICHFQDSPSHPEHSALAYKDPSQNMKLQAQGARSITYNGACVSFITDTKLNGKPGYLSNFQACDASVLRNGVGSFSITVTGPLGYLYQKSGVLTHGYVKIHSH
jgi:hypothetical protein